MATSSASAASLRQFTFFDVEQVKDIHDPNSPPELLKNASEISTMTFSSAGLVVADTHGSIHILNENFVSVASWVVHVGGRVTHVIERKGMLVTIGEEDNVRSAIMKVWDLGKMDKRTGGPTLLRSAKVQPSGKPHPASCIALTPDLSFFAVGLADGTVLLYRHLDQSLSSTSTSLTALPKPRIIHETPTEPITFLGFTSSSPTSISSVADTGQQADTHGHVASINPVLHLLITTTSSTYYYPLLPKVSSPSPVLVDEIGAGLRCADVDWKHRWVILGRDEALYACAVAGRIGLYALEGEKISVQTHLNYVVVLLPSAGPSSPVVKQRKLAGTNAGTGSPSISSTPVSTSAPKAWPPDATNTEIARVVLVDMENRFVAYSGTFVGGVRDIISAWGHIYVIGNDGKVTRLIEKPTPDKLSLLYAKNLYSLALSVAQTQGLDRTDVHRHHGDHLYSRGDYEGAMREYIQTIGGVQASYVIRKFLTAHLTPLLTTYLQELHAHGLAHAEHTTLLLNAYAKAGDVARLDAFIRSEERVFRGEGPGLVSRTDVANPGMGESKEPPFELDTAIRVCRQAGFFTHAAYLARRWGRHDDYLRVLVEDVGTGSVELKFGSGDGSKNEKGVEAVAKGETSGYREAVAYLREVGSACTESGLARYGRALLDHLPEETTQLLIDLCTSVGHLPASSAIETPPVTHMKAPSYLSYLVSSRAPVVPPALSAGDDTTITKPPGPSKEPEGGEESAEADRITGGHLKAASAPSAGSGYANGATQASRRPSPTLFFAHFVDHQVYFVRFLETVARHRWGQTLEGTVAVDSAGAEDDALERRDQAAVWNTLLELYITESQDEKEREKALRLLQSSHLPYDTMHALMLCSSSLYTPGLVLLWEKLGMYEDVLRFWMEQHHSGARAVVEPSDAAGGRELNAVSSASTQVIAALCQYGPAHPHLYPLVLRFLTSTPELLSAHQADLQEILEHVEREHIMPPLAVVQVLSRNGVASVGLVKAWLMRRIAEGHEEIETDEKLISSYRSETQAKLKQVEELTDTEHPRVFHVTRCSQCNGQLDLPSVHFMCHHSYHQRCLLDDDTTCPLCVRQHGVIQEIRRNNERLANQHELFLSEVRENGFRAVASGFGRGWLNVGRDDVVG